MPSATKILIRKAAPKDAAAIAALYNHYIQNTAVTFEEKPIKPSEIQRRMREVHADGLPWLVAMDGPALLGYAYAVKWKWRSAYRFAVESTIYLSKEAQGKGLGRRLYGELVKELKKRKLHTALGGIVLPNKASVRLHEKLGFKKAAHLKQVGFKFGKWHDVGYWQALL